MNELSVTKPYQRRRRFSCKFKAEIVAQGLEPGAQRMACRIDATVHHILMRGDGKPGQIYFWWI